MATTYSFGVTNTTASSATKAPIALGLSSNYSMVTEQPDEVVLTNKTASLNQDEYITLRSRRIKGVDPKIPILNPGPVKDAIMVGSELQCVLRETRDDGTVIDHPCVVWINGKFDIAAPWTDVPAGGSSYFQQAVMRLIGSFYTNAGSERWHDMAKKALQPVAD